MTPIASVDVSCIQNGGFATVLYWFPYHYEMCDPSISKVASEAVALKLFSQAVLSGFFSCTPTIPVAAWATSPREWRRSGKSDTRNLQRLEGNLLRTSVWENCGEIRSLKLGINKERRGKKSFYWQLGLWKLRFVGNVFTLQNPFQE